MLVRPARSRCHFATDVKLGDVSLMYVEEYRYLGHIVTSDFCDDKDVGKLFRRQNAVGNMLIHKFSFAAPEIEIHLFKTHCYPIYGNALWSNFRQYSIKKLIVSYSTTLKRMLGRPQSASTSAVFAENQTDHIKVLFRKTACSLMVRLTSSSNALVSAVCNSDAFYQSRLRERWWAMLYSR